MTLRNRSGFSIDIDGNVKLAGEKAGSVYRVNPAKGQWFRVGEWVYDTECQGGCRRIVGYYRDVGQAACALLADSHNNLSSSAWRVWNPGGPR